MASRQGGAVVKKPKKLSESKEWNLIGDYANALERIGELQRENERLRKAGDGLMFEGETMAHEVSWNPAPWDRVVAAWVAAKEGRDAK